MRNSGAVSFVWVIHQAIKTTESGTERSRARFLSGLERRFVLRTSVSAVPWNTLLAVAAAAPPDRRKLRPLRRGQHSGMCVAPRQEFVITRGHIITHSQDRDFVPLRGSHVMM